ncbi:hypothetical protein ACFRQM_41455 [Streptomyces sp. NPDC056831]|uniref:hypothetical protein n=1 Tax=Streptomyces sp. NPDC056831 TaxID=3345954 RepID=UPI003684C5FB
MENFFIPSKLWKNGGPFPHVNVLLSGYPEFREYARAHHRLLAEYGEKLGVIPEEWLHSTVGFPNKTYRGSIRQTRCLVAADG